MRQLSVHVRACPRAPPTFMPSSWPGRRRGGPRRRQAPAPLRRARTSWQSPPSIRRSRHASGTRRPGRWRAGIRPAGRWRTARRAACCCAPRARTHTAPRRRATAPGDARAHERNAPAQHLHTAGQRLAADAFDHPIDTVLARQPLHLGHEASFDAVPASTSLRRRPPPWLQTLHAVSRANRSRPPRRRAQRVCRRPRSCR